MNEEVNLSTDPWMDESEEETTEVATEEDGHILQLPGETNNFSRDEKIDGSGEQNVESSDRTAKKQPDVRQPMQSKR